MVDAADSKSNVYSEIAGSLTITGLPFFVPSKYPSDERLHYNYFPRHDRFQDAGFVRFAFRECKLSCKHNPGSRGTSQTLKRQRLLPLERL